MSIVRVWAGGALLAWVALGNLAAAADSAPLANPFKGAAAAYLTVVDGAALWGDAVAAPLPPASLTKLMTALLAAEALPPAQAVVVSRTAAAAGGARLGLAAGERMTADSLLAALLMRSANDACLALAEAIDGSQTRFVARMNRAVERFGLRETHFENACGFDAAGQRSSARDVAALAARVMANPALARWTAAERHTVRSLDGKAYPLRNTNVLLGLLPGLRGVKTGYTAGAGRCFAGYAERDGHAVIVVLLGAGDRWWDAVAMFERAFVSRGVTPPATANGR